MSGIGPVTGRDDEIVNIDYVQAGVTVGTTEVEAKVDTLKLERRQMLRIYNASNSVVYFGPSGVTTSTGEPLEKKQWVNIPIGDKVAVYLIAGSAGNSVIVSEWA